MKMQIFALVILSISLVNSATVPEVPDSYEDYDVKSSDDHDVGDSDAILLVPGYQILPNAHPSIGQVPPYPPYAGNIPVGPRIQQVSPLNHGSPTSGSGFLTPTQVVGSVVPVGQPTFKGQGHVIPGAVVSRECHSCPLDTDHRTCKDPYFPPKQFPVEPGLCDRISNFPTEQARLCKKYGKHPGYYVSCANNGMSFSCRASCGIKVEDVGKNFTINNKLKDIMNSGLLKGLGHSSDNDNLLHGVGSFGGNSLLDFANTHAQQSPQVNQGPQVHQGPQGQQPAVHQAQQRPAQPQGHNPNANNGGFFHNNFQPNYAPAGAFDVNKPLGLHGGQFNNFNFNPLPAPKKPAHDPFRNQQFHNQLQLNPQPQLQLPAAKSHQQLLPQSFLQTKPQPHQTHPQPHQNIPQPHQNFPQTHQNFPQAHQNFPQTHQNFPQHQQHFPQTHQSLPQPTQRPYVPQPTQLPYAPQPTQLPYAPQPTQLPFHGLPQPTQLPYAPAKPQPFQQAHQTLPQPTQLPYAPPKPQPFQQYPTPKPYAPPPTQPHNNQQPYKDPTPTNLPYGPFLPRDPKAGYQPVQPTPPHPAPAHGSNNIANVPRQAEPAGPVPYPVAPDQTHVDTVVHSGPNPSYNNAVPVPGPVHDMLTPGPDYYKAPTQGPVPHPGYDTNINPVPSNSQGPAGAPSPPFPTESAPAYVPTPAPQNYQTPQVYQPHQPPKVPVIQPLSHPNTVAPHPFTAFKDFEPFPNRHEQRTSHQPSTQYTKKPHIPTLPDLHLPNVPDHGDFDHRPKARRPDENEAAKAIGSPFTNFDFSSGLDNSHRFGTNQQLSNLNNNLQNQVKAVDQATAHQGLKNGQQNSASSSSSSSSGGYRKSSSNSDAKEGGDASHFSKGIGDSANLLSNLNKGLNSRGSSAASNLLQGSDSKDSKGGDVMEGFLNGKKLAHGSNIFGGNFFDFMKK